ncbi:MAG: ATP synthase F1 subunit epsilon [Candidatus Marinimicrobia bacterium]|nr:ATP synthase F1 subunit epsilon [Candidatus Neomarinimicrobiota bacterium]
MQLFNLDIVTPIKEVKLGEINYLRCPGIDGSFGIMNKHREGIIALTIGEIKITKDGKSEYYATGGGFAEILDNSVKLIVESVEKSSDIDSVRAQKSLDRANQRKIEKDSEINNIRVETSLLRALNRLRVSKR